MLTEQSDIDQIDKFDDSGVRVVYRRPSQRFSSLDEEQIDQAMKHLEDNGFVVLSDVLNREEIDQSKQLIWQYLERLKSPYTIRRNDIRTWNIWPGRHEAGIIEEHGAGNSHAQWFIRSIPKIKDIFARVWKTRNLLSSMDGIGLFRPWHLNPNIPERDREIGRNSWKTVGGNWHVDQNPLTKPNRVCVQGIVNLLEADQHTGGLMVIPRSHLRFHELKSIWKKTGNNCKVPNSHEILRENYGLLIHGQPGDLLLWDSRTVHCNSPSFDQPRRDGLLRMVSYVCMTPVSFAENLDQLIEKREHAFRYRLTTSHWPHEFQVMGGEHSSSENTIQLTDYQRNLILGLD